MSAHNRFGIAALSLCLAIGAARAAVLPDSSGALRAAADTSKTKPDSSAAKADSSVAKPDTSAAAADTSRAAPADTARALPDTTRAARPDSLHPVVAAPDSAREALFASLVGTWAGTVSHGEEEQSFAFGFAPGKEGQIEVYLSMPVVHLDRVPFASGEPVAEGDSIQLGSLRFALDRAKGEMRGILPAALVPYYAIPYRLKRVDRFDMPARDTLRVPDPEPVWSFDAGSPIWAGPIFADGLVIFGAKDGQLIALDAKSGSRQWDFHCWGAVRARPALWKDMLYVQADDGALYAVDVKKGHLRWKQRITDQPIERLPFDDPKSKYDRFSSDVTVEGDKLYVGTHEGRVLALKAKDGKPIWDFRAQGAVLAAPVLEDGKVIFGSYDHFVYALNEKDGQLLWKRDTHGAVVSTPALFGDRAVVGNRVYDLLGIDARTGRVLWKSYIWMSWVESSASAFDGIAYVVSSDATAVYAYQAETGKRLWASDVQGWSWGEPAVTDTRVYVGTSSQVGYGPDHTGAAMALDRETGAAVWRFPAARPDTGDYGFAGSPALGPDFVYFAGLDGKVYAFEP